MDEGNEKKNDVIKEVFIMALLIGVIVVRFSKLGDDNTFIKCIGYIGVLVSLVDLYVDASRKYASFDKFNVLKGWAYFIAIIMAIILMLLLTESIPINSKWSDEFTLLALLVSLPEKIYLNWIDNYVRRKK
ncbi:MAG: hypothetical protein PHD56_08690 [Anaerostipes sp.]|nr:hypothetical protein [Anaerostipes sp.]